MSSHRPDRPGGRNGPPDRPEPPEDADSRGERACPPQADPAPSGPERPHTTEPESDAAIERAVRPADPGPVDAADVAAAASTARADEEHRPAARPTAEEERRPAARPTADAERRPATRPAAEEEHRPAARPTADAEHRPAARPAADAEMPRTGFATGRPHAAVHTEASPSPACPDEPAGTRGSDEPEEDALRHLLQESVRGIEPSPDALRALQRAVPARRRRRGRLVAATTTVAVLAVATPVTLQAASLVTSDDQPVEASHDQHHSGSTGTGDGLGDGPGTQDTGSGEGFGDHSEGRPESSDEPSPEESVNGGTEADEEEQELLAGSYPRCARDQLGDVRTEIGDPVDGGLVYGSIQLTNISDTTCRIRGTDELTVSTQNGSGDAGIAAEPRVVDRTDGDRAVHLPLEEDWHDELVLPPGEAYAVAFAWVPHRGQESGACAASPLPDTPPADAGGGAAGGGGAGGGDHSDDTGSEDGGGGGAEGVSAGPDGEQAPGADGSPGADPGSGGSLEGVSGEPGGDTEAGGIVVRYTPAAGQPRAARFELAGSCAGSLHRTGVLEGTAP